MRGTGADGKGNMGDGTGIKVLVFKGMILLPRSSIPSLLSACIVEIFTCFGEASLVEEDQEEDWSPGSCFWGVVGPLLSKKEL